MFPLLFWIPFGVSLVLGVVFVFLGDAGPGPKILVVAAFVVAAWLQFFSSYALAGLLLQIALALYLALWRRLRFAT